MKLNRKFAVTALALAAVLGLSGCSASSAPKDSTKEVDSDALQVGFIVSAGGLNDHSFNYLGNEGMKRAESELGVKIRVLNSSSNADYIPNMTTLARQGFDLIIASGFNEIEAVSAVSKSFPNVKFAMVDVSVSQLDEPRKNVIGLPFEQSQASYLAGYLAALYLDERGAPEDALGAIGGQPIPPVQDWLAGFTEGVAAASPDRRVIQGYSQTFSDPAKCVQLAQTQIQQGAKVLFHAAGGCGQGVLNAAKEAGVFAVGSDADQSNYGEHVLTSALKRADVAVFETIRDLTYGKFEGSTDRVFGIKDGGVGVGTISPLVSAAIKDQVKQAEEKLRESASTGSK